MAKKARRVRRKQGGAVRLSPAQMVRPVEQDRVAAVASVAAPVRGVKTTGVRREGVNLQEEYQYVVADLKRIGILALIMLGMLIGLALVLT